MVERRKYERYRMPGGTFVILRNELDRLRDHSQMSIGEIAMVLYKSEPEVMGQVTDMSFGGLAFTGNHGGVSDSDHVELDLLMTEQGIYLHNIPYVTVPIKHSGRGKQRTPKYRTNALRFKNLNAEIKVQLKALLAHHVG